MPKQSASQHQEQSARLSSKNDEMMKCGLFKVFHIVSTLVIQKCRWPRPVKTTKKQPALLVYKLDTSDLRNLKLTPVPAAQIKVLPAR